MLNVLLAGLICALALGVYLLFRQLRSISWQLTLLRVDRDTDRMLRAIGARPNDSSEPHVPDRPVRRKRHLDLYIGGAAAAVLTFGREIRAHPATALASTGAAVLIAAIATLLILAPGARERAGEPHRPPSPTARPTADWTLSARPPAPSNTPSVRSGGGPVSEAAATRHRIAVRTVIPAPSPTPDGQASLPAGSTTPSAPATTRTLGTPSAPPGPTLSPSPALPSTEPSSSSCLGTTLRPLLMLDLCLPALR